jgi:N-acetylmuramoyl-L-alanine amidase
MVPVEFVNRALALIYDARLDLRKPSRLLIVGDLRVPRLTIRFEAGDPARLVVDATPRTDSALSQQGMTLTVKFDADALDAAIPPVQPQGLVQAIRLLEPASLTIDLGPRFAAFRSSAQPTDSSTRLTIDIQSAAPPEPAVPAQPPVSQNAPLPDLSSLGLPTSAVRTIAIDPGHGGEDEGVKGAGGTKEKDLALSVARRLKAAIEARLGVRVVLTRDDDHNIAIDGRTAIANNNKADLLISLHANASFRKGATGASILYAGFDREEAETAAASLSIERLPTFGGGLRDVDLVLWQRAQLRHLSRSTELANILLAQLRDHIPLSTHPMDRAPLNVLASANMPAVLVEMGYLSNEEQEAQMNGNEFQNTIVQAIYDGVLKFRDALGAGTQ